jgi:hypothetical protein
MSGRSSAMLVLAVFFLFIGGAAADHKIAERFYLWN